MMNTRRALAVLAAVAATGFGGSAFAQTNQSVDAGITIFQPSLIVAKNSDLSFGSVSRPTAGNGTVTIDANSGTVTTTGGVTAISGNPATRATFTVTGVASANIQVTYPGSFNLTRTGGSETLPVTLTTTMGGGQIGSGGTVNFAMGGQVLLSSTTVAGAYTGTYNVTVAYN
jgi:hypothetical protein